MNLFEQIQSSRLSQFITIKAQWTTQKKMIVSAGLILFEKHIVVPANDIILEENSKQRLCSRFLVEQNITKRQYDVELQEKQFQLLDIDNDDFIAYIELSQKRRKNKKYFIGNICFINLKQKAFVKGLEKINISQIEPKDIKLNQNYMKRKQRFLQISQEGEHFRLSGQNSKQGIHSQNLFQSYDNMLQQLEEKDKEEQFNEVNFKKYKQKMIVEKLKPSLKQNFPEIKHKKVELLPQQNNLLPSQNLQKQQPKAIIEHSTPIQMNFQNKFWDQTTKYGKYFSIEERKITRTKENHNQLYQIVSIEPIFEDISSFIFELQYGQKGYGIGIGIVTENKRTQQCSVSSQTVQLSTWKSGSYGSMFMDRDKLYEDDHSLYMMSGDMLFMQVDLKQFAITFNIADKKVLHHKLVEEHWRTYNIYVCVWLGQNGASIRLL